MDDIEIICEKRGCCINMDYKKRIMELLPQINNEKWMKRIYIIVRECVKEEKRQCEERNQIKKG